MAIERGKVKREKKNSLLPARKVRKKHAIFSSRFSFTLYGAILLAIVVLIIHNWYSARHITKKEKLVATQPSPTASPTMAIPTPCPVLSTPSQITFPTDGKIHLLPNLSLEKEDPCFPSSYFSAGIVPSGKYAGYKRILTVSVGPGVHGSLYITDDFKKYYQVIAASEQMYYQGKSTVYTDEVIGQDFPADIPLPNGFALHRSDVYLSNKKGQFTFPYANTLITDFSSYTSLSSFANGLKFYAQPVNTKLYTNANDSVYFSDLTGVIAVDASGLSYVYNLTTPSNINIYNKAIDAKDPNAYEHIPSLAMESNDIVTDRSLYPSYNAAVFDQGCGGFNGDTLVAKTIQYSELQKIGIWEGIEIYALKDGNNPLYKSLYQSIAGPDPSSPKIPLPTNSPIPAYTTYIAKTPLLFIKDPWNRWDVLAETQYDPKYIYGMQVGGCGKPVMYFYPQQKTEVKVSFTSPMRLDVQIPKYRNGWDILVQKNGMINDLLQQDHDCDAIDPNRAGEEYALDACRKNQYPYIYWSGQTITTSYDLPSEGFIVARDNLTQFMNTSLETIGFLPKEKEDMLSYWLPKMIAKQVPYYRIYFLQTPEVDALFPLTISPHPDSHYRIFMDWEPLAAKPSYTLTPEKLATIDRKGFFMLEWGGVNR